jgi:hypothetical protein
MTVLTVMLVMSVLAFVTMLVLASFVALMPGRVHLPVPVIRYEVDRPAAGVVLAAMLGPMPLMARRNVQVKRLGRWTGHDYGRRCNHGLRHDQLGRGQPTADRDLSIKARGVYIDCEAHIASLGDG